MPETKEVVVTRKAFYKGILRGIGEELTIPATTKGKWFVEKASFKPTEEDTEPEPQTFSELAAVTGKPPVKRKKDEDRSTDQTVI
jgi:hypothetical protein